MEDWRHGGFGIYLHWPFCQAKCPYCDFNSHVAATIDQKRWQTAFLSEIDRISHEVPDRIVNTIYFGGGTPSLMDPTLVDAILGRIRDVWPQSNDIEITLEANPTSSEAGRFQAYRDAGVNRISMGFQALNDADLKRLGRLHSVAEGRAAFDIARNTFERVSFDLIYARQDQTLGAWKKELREALSLAADHLSLYQLTIEAGTAFGDRYDRGLLKGLPDDDISTDMYFATQELCGEAGLPAYEVSNHAKIGAESRHNLIYWRYGDYAGIGPGAHGRLTINGQRNEINTPLFPEAWLQSVEQNGNGEKTRRALPEKEQAIEYLLMGLRISNGIDLNRVSDMYGDVFDIKNKYLFDEGLIEKVGNTLKVTPKGRPLLNAILREIIPAD